MYSPPHRLVSFTALQQSGALQLRCGVGEDFDETCFGLGVVFETLADGLAQMIARGLDERRQGATTIALAALGTLPAVHALAECAQPAEHGLDQIAVGLEI